MSKLIYIANLSLDGFIEDSHGNFDWTAPNDEVFAFITDLVRSSGTYLYGRRMYETMAVWETDPAVAAQSELMSDFAHVWQAANKVVYSTTLHEVSTARTQLKPNFDPCSQIHIWRRGSMLGEGLTTAAAAQQPKFDEAAFDRPRRTRRRLATWLLVFVALLIAGVAIVL
jgi:hypothetical protein